MGNFFLSKGKSIQVEMMSMEGQMVYFKEDDEDYYVLAKPFKVRGNVIKFEII